LAKCPWLVPCSSRPIRTDRREICARSFIARSFIATAAGFVCILDTPCLDLRPIMRYADRSKVGVLMPSSRFPIPQGTLDMLILQVLSLDPVHGYGIARRLDQIS